MVSPLVVSLRKQKGCYGSRVKLISPAKINLYLNILGEYRSPVPTKKDQFCRIESIVERISLFDEITVTVQKTPNIEIAVDEEDFKVNDNLCCRAAELLKKTFSLPFGFRIKLKKKIPVGSGLGGGSSNAATVLLGISMLLGLKMRQEDLYSLGAALGSDVNFFLSRSPFAYLSGRGEKVSLIQGEKLHHFVIWPKVILPTKKVYQAYRSDSSKKLAVGRGRVKLTKFFSNVKIMKYALKRGDVFLLKKSTFNILERYALALCKEVRQVKDYLERRGICAKVTGSGSALYTIMERSSLSRIRGILPKKWLVFTAHTF
ncbi:MAG: 4-(cytidine 5'-diphospho)-2-C-methyl-D-erythritol kinase [Candidatus Omnitrophota bacterium]|nr:MAG: 4-(cytidine 5'-diphospho)-2-C-methyl-D-erythritol kinase [Candidatus Omnitrophota bacterium]